jgi:hypothetical protein
MIPLFAACFAFYMVQVIRWQYKLKFLENIDPDGIPTYHYPMNTKPFNCITCLSAWTGFITALLAGEGYSSIMYLFISAVAGILLDKFMR